MNIRENIRSKLEIIIKPNYNDSCHYNLKDLCKLKSIVNGKLYFNFNYRHSLFAKSVIKYLLDKELGKLIYILFIGEEKEADAN